MELENFFKSVMPVADYFDQSDMLVAVSIARKKRWETEKSFSAENRNRDGAKFKVFYLLHRLLKLNIFPLLYSLFNMKKKLD